MIYLLYSSLTDATQFGINCRKQVFTPLDTILNTKIQQSPTIQYKEEL